MLWFFQKLLLPTHFPTPGKRFPEQASEWKQGSWVPHWKLTTNGCWDIQYDFFWTPHNLTFIGNSFPSFGIISLPRLCLKKAPQSGVAVRILHLWLSTIWWSCWRRRVCSLPKWLAIMSAVPHLFKEEKKLTGRCWWTVLFFKQVMVHVECLLPLQVGHHSRSLFGVQTKSCICQAAERDKCGWDDWEQSTCRKQACKTGVEMLSWVTLFSLLSFSTLKKIAF